MIFQDALSSLDPVFTVGSQIVETLKIHQDISNKEAWNYIGERLSDPSYCLR